MPGLRLGGLPLASRGIGHRLCRVSAARRSGRGAGYVHFRVGGRPTNRRVVSGREVAALVRNNCCVSSQPPANGEPAARAYTLTDLGTQLSDDGRAEEATMVAQRKHCPPSGKPWPSAGSWPE